MIMEIVEGDAWEMMNVQDWLMNMTGEPGSSEALTIPADPADDWWTVAGEWWPIMANWWLVTGDPITGDCWLVISI